MAAATSRMVAAMREEASGLSDRALQDRLLQSAKILAEATAKMIAAAKLATTDPDDPEAQAGLRKATDDLKAAVSLAAGDTLRKRVSDFQRGRVENTTCLFRKTRKRFFFSLYAW